MGASSQQRRLPRRPRPARARSIQAVAAALAILCGGALAIPAPAPGQQASEEEVKRQRKAGGLHAGTWQVTDLAEPEGADISTLPSFWGYFQNGLDLHLALENGLGFWGRTVEDSDSKTSVFLIPQFTSLKIYPFTRPDEAVEPYLLGGAGITLGIEDREGGGTLIGVGDGTTFKIGFGVRGGAGVQLGLSDAFGLVVNGEYRWNRFFDGEIGGKESYAGFLLSGGVTYNFQFR